MAALTERQEALSQTAEIAGMRAKNEQLMGESLDAIHALGGLAQAHEQRLNNQEGSLVLQYMPQCGFVGSRSAPKPPGELN